MEKKRKMKTMKVKELYNKLEFPKEINESAPDSKMDEDEVTV